MQRGRGAVGQIDHVDNALRLGRVSQFLREWVARCQRFLTEDVHFGREELHRDWMVHRKRCAGRTFNLGR